MQLKKFLIIALFSLVGFVVLVQQDVSADVITPATCTDLGMDITWYGDGAGYINHSGFWWWFNGQYRWLAWNEYWCTPPPPPPDGGPSPM